MKSKFCIIFAFFSIFLLIFFEFFFFDYFYPIRYKDVISIYAKEFNVDKAIIFSVANVESGFDKDVISSAGAVGVMQLLPRTASWLCEMLEMEYFYENLFDEKYNIKLGSYYLSYLIARFEQLDFALAAYNAGPSNVASWLDENVELTVDDIPFVETRNYVYKVKRCMKVYSWKS